VHVYETGSTTQIGEAGSATNANINDLRKAIFAKDFAGLEGRKFNQLVVRPTRGGEPLAARTKLSAVRFECEDDGSLHAYVEVPPKAEEAGIAFCAKLIACFGRRAFCDKPQATSSAVVSIITII